MSIPLIINGVTFQYPETNDTDWGSTATSWASAVSSGLLQKSGGSFSLLADVNFGANFGLTSKYYKSGSAAIAMAGVFRLAKTDTINFRNNADSADLALGIDTNDRITFNSTLLTVPSDLVAGSVVVTPNGNLASTDAQSAFVELQGDIDTLNTNLGNHISDTADAHDASAISSVASGNLVATDVQAALNELQSDVDLRELASNRGAANGYCPLGADSKVSATYLPSYVDDVIEVANFAALPVTGEAGKIYVTLDTNLTYRWSGSAYVEISQSLALGELSTTAYRGDRGAVAYSHSQSNSGVHGITGNVVGTSDAQVLTAKDIDGGTSSNTSRVTLPKNTLANNNGLTRKEATLLYSTDTQKAYIDNGSTLVAVGSGSGSGSLATYVQLKSDDDVDSWSTGNNASFLGGGSVAGTFTKQNATNPLNGTYSYTFTQAAGSLNDYIASPVIAVPLRAKNASTAATNLCRMKAVYDGANSDLKVIVYDVTNATILNNTQTLTSNADYNKKHEFLFDLPSSCTQIRFGIQVLALNSGKVLKFDDVEFTDDPFFTFENVTQEGVSYTGYTSKDGSNRVLFKTKDILRSDEATLINVQTSGYTKYTINKTCKVNVSASLVGTSGYAAIRHYNASGTLVKYTDIEVRTAYGAPSSLTTIAVNGDYFTVDTNSVPSDSALTNFNITAIDLTTKNSVIQLGQTADRIGETVYLPQSTPPKGFIPANGVSIGKSSGTYQGSEYYNLYMLLWNIATNTVGEPYYLSSPKGASAQADYDATKTITIDESGFFTRAYKSGTSGAIGAKQLDAFQGHQHNIPFSNGSGGGSYPVGQQASALTTPTTAIVTDGTNGAPRVSTETRPINIAKYVFIRYANAGPELYALPVAVQQEYKLECITNSSQVITLNSTDIPFTLNSQTGISWNGTSFNAPLDGVYSIKGSIKATNNFTGVLISAYVGGVKWRSIHNPNTTNIFPISIDVPLLMGQSFSLKSDTTFTLSPDNYLHWLSVVRLNGKNDSVFIGGDVAPVQTAKVVYDTSGTRLVLSTSAQAIPLNAVKGLDASIVSLNANQFTLQKGSYSTDFAGYYYNNGAMSHASRIYLYNVTDAVEVDTGIIAGGRYEGLSWGYVPSTGSSSFSIASAKVFELRTISVILTGTAYLGDGYATPFAEKAFIKIMKLGQRTT